MKEYKYTVIGAGIIGLSIVNELLKRGVIGHDILLVEKKTLPSGNKASLTALRSVPWLLDTSVCITSPTFLAASTPIWSQNNLNAKITSPGLFL